MQSRREDRKERGWLTCSMGTIWTYLNRFTRSIPDMRFILLHINDNDNHKLQHALQYYKSYLGSWVHMSAVRHQTSPQHLDPPGISSPGFHCRWRTACASLSENRDITLIFRVLALFPSFSYNVSMKIHLHKLFLGTWRTNSETIYISSHNATSEMLIISLKPKVENGVSQRSLSGFQRVPSKISGLMCVFEGGFLTWKDLGSPTLKPLITLRFIWIMIHTCRLQQGKPCWW